MPVRGHATRTHEWENPLQMRTGDYVKRPYSVTVMVTVPWAMSIASLANAWST